MQNIDAFPNPHRVHRPVRVGIEAGDDLEHTASHPFERLGIGGLVAFLGIIQGHTDFPAHLRREFLDLFQRVPDPDNGPSLFIIQLPFSIL